MTTFPTHTIPSGGLAFDANTNGKLKLLIEPAIIQVVQNVYKEREHSTQEIII